MKMKSFATLAASGLLAGFVAYIAPAMADYTNATNPSMQQTNPVDTTNNNASNVGAAQTDQNNQANPTTPQNSYNIQNTPPADSDQPVPDTATGDDDY